MNILAIDTSNHTLGIALLQDDKVVGEYITNMKKNHSVRAMPAIEQLMKECGLKPNQLDKIVVAKGPGSYTGVRIGVTIAKTLAWTLGIPLSGVSSLKALAANGAYFSGYISPLFDARRGQIYTGLYKQEEEGLVCVKEDQILQSSDWATILAKLDGPVLFIGEDIPLHKEVLEEALEDRAIFADPSCMNPRPGALAVLGKDMENEDIHTFVPNYVRLAEAEANWLKEQKKKSAE
ncbi:tRNA (adenosine(37)-N6)-threonylcarbamoyltransferase complex dimerization subunit type 1 TsaB [Bacillus testis]|uniref:tRNA (adenosine(37)-N6)-threonylcarbamoyltransferase complex dimerization subunit type 1 TsaB n=1 Tax=Bacillus testis TaxID=1622072 RepID=UPI00067F2F9D|nr:tRNA (adenosine(37)-N6)-threonylcarbamoyltransferase complex dimerization subunit type 1 TsaB [Bacillus testis]